MEQIMQALIDNVIVPLLAIAGTALMAYVTNLVNTKIKSEKIKNAYAAVAEQAFSVVNGLQEVVVKDLKAAAVDGKLTADEIGQIKCDAINQIKATVTGSTLTLLQSEAVDVDALIVVAINSALAQVKRMSPQ